MSEKRGAAMSLTAAVRGFVILLLVMPAVHGEDDWGVTYSPTQICALKGSTVEIRCSFTYPSRINGVKAKVGKTLWFTRASNNVYVDLKTEDRRYTNREDYRGDESTSTLRIRDLRQSDSAEYKFRFTINQETAKYTGLPGVSLTVTGLQVHVSRLRIYESYSWMELKCHSSCPLPGPPHYIWFRNGQSIQGQTSDSYSGNSDPADRYSCAVRGREDVPSPSVYCPKLPSVSVSPSAEIVEGSSVTLSCSTDANPAAKYSWYKKSANTDVGPLSEEPQLVFMSIQSSDSGEYYCKDEHRLGTRITKYVSIDVKYGPKLPSVSVSPSAEIVEGSSVTLSCSTDANPAANYTWYKGNQKPLRGPGGSFHLRSISSEDSGIYYCTSENQYGQINSSSLFIDVQYGPKRPSVSVSPSAEIVEGSSVTLSCSTDANPAANYTWYKEDEDSPKASGQNFTITDVRAQHSGIYYCEAQNSRGRHKSTLHLTVAAVFSGPMKSAVVGAVLALSLAIIWLSVFLLLRRKAASRQSSVPEGGQDNREQCLPNQSEDEDNLHYASIRFSKNNTDPVYANIQPAGLHRHTEEDEVEYSAVKFDSASTSQRSPESLEDPSELYSRVNKIC